MKVIILAGGKGSKLWPYAEIRNKSMMKISNKPIISHTVEYLSELDNVEEIHIVGFSFMNDMANTFRRNKKVIIHITPECKGSSETLATVQNIIDKDVLILFGDCLIQKEDILDLVNSKPNTILVDRCIDSCKNHIIANVDNESLTNFIGHPRGYSEGYLMFGFHAKANFREYLQFNKGRFSNTKVGVSSPHEHFIEETINVYLEDNQISTIKSKYKCFDIDKPWQILEANSYNNEMICKAIKKNEIGNNSSISNEATIKGLVKLGDNSSIGKNVVINGNCVIGNNTIIDNGAIIDGDTVIGDNCLIRNNCKIGSHSSIGNLCIVEQTAEFLSGILLEKSYLYHHCEIFGILGEKVDIGAGTICGTLRFDDGETTVNIKGRKEIPTHYSNATYLGDYVRTGVGVIFQPGARVGINSVIGSGVILNQTVENNRLIYVKQELVEKEWGSDRYGW